MAQREVVDDLTELLAILPGWIRQALEDRDDLEDLIEVVMDIGRAPEARFPDRFVVLGGQTVEAEDIEYVLERISPFGPDNRAGIERTLHRISGIRNRSGEIVGLTCRVGRAVFGTIDLVRDFIEQGRSVLLLGRPGVGKTTLLRETARVLADEFGRRVIIVDTSNEIAGDGDVPHPAIGRSRRMQVPHGVDQAAVMIEAVENHMPEVIVIDEIGTESEAEAARTIAERGVQLIGTAHGNTLSNLIQNPTLSDLVGGIQAVILGDEEAKKRGTQKTVLERKAPPTFDVVIEIQDRNQVALHADVAATVDLLLRGVEPKPEMRRRSASGGVEVVQASNLQELQERRRPDNGAQKSRPKPARNGILRIFPYGVSRNRLEKAVEESGAPIAITKEMAEADMVVTLKGQYRKLPKRLRAAETRGLPVHVLRSNTQAQIQAFVDGLKLGDGGAGKALFEAEQAIQQALAGIGPIDLDPQSPYLRRLQHELVERHRLRSTSVGTEPHRRVRVLPRGYRPPNEQGS